MKMEAWKSKNAVFAVEIRRINGVNRSVYSPLFVLNSERQSVIRETVGRDIMNEPLWVPSFRGKGISYHTLDISVRMWYHGALNTDVKPHELTRSAKQPVMKL